MFGHIHRKTCMLLSSIFGCELRYFWIVTSQALVRRALVSCWSGLMHHTGTALGSTWSGLELISPCAIRIWFWECNFQSCLRVWTFRSPYDNTPRWMPWDRNSDKSTLVQVMAWSCQATRHYLNQCWPRFVLPYGVTRPQWVNQSVNVCKWCVGVLTKTQVFTLHTSYMNSYG